MATGNIYGKTNNPVKIVNNEYTGLETDTTSTIVNNDDKTIAVEVKQELLDKIDSLETQVSVYNYFSSLWDEDSEPTVWLPVQDTKYILRELCSKWVPEEGDEADFENYYKVTVTENNFIVGKAEVSESYFYESEPMFDENVPFEVTLYQTGALADIKTTRFAYDNIDLINSVVNRYCIAVSIAELISTVEAQGVSSDIGWSSSNGGSIQVKGTAMTSFLGIYFESGFVIKTNQHDALTFVFASSNFSIRNIQSVEPSVSSKKTAVAYLKTLTDYLLVFKRVSILHEPFEGVLLVKEIPCNMTYKAGITQTENATEYFTIQASYLSLQDLVYSKDQSDTKFLTKEENNKAEHIIKLGDVEARDAHTVYEVLHQHESHYPKFAYANMIAPTEEVENPVPFRSYTFFINQRKEIITEVEGVQTTTYEYSYRVLSQNKEYILKDGSWEEVSGGASLDVLKNVVIDSSNDPAVITFPENVLPIRFYWDDYGYTFYFNYNTMAVLDDSGYSVGSITYENKKVVITIDGAEGYIGDPDYDQLTSWLIDGSNFASVELNAYNLYYQKNGPSLSDARISSYVNSSDTRIMYLEISLPIGIFVDQVSFNGVWGGQTYYMSIKQNQNGGYQLSGIYPDGAGNRSYFYDVNTQRNIFRITFTKSSGTNSAFTNCNVTFFNFLNYCGNLSAV